jgi:Fe-S-cluster-containing dehydrogenase component/DMSO reductase anchor subunit
VTATLIDRYIAEQAQLTAVERFARHHEQAEPDGDLYRALLPASPPGPGQQYGFEVELDSCTGCKSCVAACRSLNGLDADESWRRVGGLYGLDAGEPVQQTVTTACHHCVDPACLSGCPVDAYEKDPVTGIVSHLDDQCIGCRYCTLMCPYEVPRFSPSRGIVRKCDMCAGRLAEGEAPACVQACPTSAIRIAVVDVAVVRAEAATGATLVPGAPSSSLTVPTTRYRTAKAPLVSVQAADHVVVQPAHAHTPLAVMLVLTQLAAGAFVADMLMDRSTAMTIVAVVAGWLALGASVLHLGRPTQAWRAVIGLRHSWLSREVVAFGAFAGLATLYAAASLLGAPPGTTALGWAAAASGLAGVACSVCIYAVTRRTWWRAHRTGGRFAFTTVATGLAVALVAAVADGDPIAGPLAGLLALSTLVALLAQVAILRHRWDVMGSDLGRTASLLTGELRRPFVARLAGALAGGVVVPVIVLAVPSGLAGAVVASIGLVVLVAAELCERWLFFTAVAGPRMPGALR